MSIRVAGHYWVKTKDYGWDTSFYRDGFFFVCGIEYPFESNHPFILEIGDKIECPYE